MIRCALALTRSPETSTPLARSPSISSLSTRGSTTTPLPITHSLPGWRMPLGMRGKAHFSPSRTIVWPALLPPWKRTTMSARSASRSTILPLPSSPHWTPTMTMPGMREGVWQARRPGRQATCLRASGDLLARVLAEERHDRAHLLQARDRALVDLARELVALEVRRDDDRALLLVARVDDGVELLEHPLRGLLGADVVDVQQVDRGEAVEERDV